MITLKGEYNTARVFTDNLESGAAAQIEELLNQPFVAGSKIRIMPDAHAGAGCTIGTTMTLAGKVVPNLVGVDIGCGMETVILKDKRVELQKLDKAIHAKIPVGFEIRTTEHPLIDQAEIDKLRCAKSVNLQRARLSMGTLGGGNHFIELNQDDEGRLYLVVHSGSRHLGKQVADYYQKMAREQLKKQDVKKYALIAALKADGREEEIQAELKKIQPGATRDDLAYLEGKFFEDYIHDMRIVQRYAQLNRQAIVDQIVREMKLKIEDSFTTTHNYIDLDDMILRKGAVSAKEGERLLIPINMRDGSLLCRGKGNADWNYSAPHGAGRLMSRSEAGAS